MKLTINQWKKLELLAAYDYREKEKAYRHEHDCLAGKGLDDWEIDADAYVATLKERKRKAYELWQALATQTI